MAQAAEAQNTASPLTVLLIGKTGMGKSTTGNKLLNAATDDNLKGSVKVKKDWPLQERHAEGSMYFAVNDTVESGTQNCALLSNTESGIRVLDTVGFAGSNSRDGAYLGNLRVMRQIVGVSSTCGLRYDRILYFLPQRLYPEKADANLEEEIEVMWYFFKDTIFRNMVLVFTIPDYITAPVVVDEKKVQKVFNVALSNVVKKYDGSSLPPCPPVIHIPSDADSSEVTTLVQTVVVHGQNRVNLLFREDTCAKCASMIYYRRKEGDSQRSLVGVEAEEEIVLPEITMCHPTFVPKYSRLQKILGGIAHVMVLGFAKVHELRTGESAWPGFLNSEEVCVNCKHAPGCRGCMRVMKEKYGDSFVQHSNDIHSVVICND